MPDTTVFRFSRFELRTQERRLLVDGTPAALGARAFDVLEALIGRAGEVVTKEQLLDMVWAGAVVEENNLPSQIWALRKVLGPDIIVTAPGRGYRFVATIERGEPPPDAAATATATAAAAASTTAASSTTAPGAPKLRTNLPPVQPTLLGRDDDLLALAALVGRHRLVSIVGPGGMGKSLLAQCLLLRNGNAYTHGVCWAEMAAVAEASTLPGAIATALGLQVGGGDALAALVRAVAPLQLLLALDNAEHLLAELAQIAHVLHDAAPGLRIVVTSQAPLRLPQEQVFRLGPLSVPNAALPADDAVAFGAVALFVERARAVDTRFVLTDGQAADVIVLCRALDGLPLAIELAAARAPVLGLPRLVASLGERLNLLTHSANRWAPARQQTLRSAMAWSHGFLELREQLVFRRLGVMVGSASLDMVQQLVCSGEGVGGDDPIDAWAALSALQVLVDRSLVVVVQPDGASHETRYRLLETPRAYALERLADSGELPALCRRHAMASAAYCAQAWAALWAGQSGVDDWMALQESELANAKQAFTWAQAHGEARVALDIGRLLMVGLPRSRYAERMAVADVCQTLVGDDTLPAASRLQTLLAMSEQWIDTRLPRGEAATQQALHIARGLDAQDGASFWLYFALSQSASILARQHALGAAAAALADMRTLEDPAWPPQRRSIGAVADYTVARVVGEPVAALKYARRLVALRRGAGASGHLSVINLIDAEIAAGEAQAAVQTGQALLAQLEGSRDAHGLAFLRLNLTAAWLALDQPAPARALAQAGSKQAARFDHTHYWADYVALLAAQEGRPRAAALMVGLADRGYLAKQVARERNEAAACEQACQLARACLGDTVFHRLREEGGLLRDDALGTMGLDTEEV